MVVRWSLVERGSERTALRTRWRREREREGTGFMGATKSTCIALLRWPFPFLLLAHLPPQVPTKTVQGGAGQGRATLYKIQLQNPLLLLRTAPGSSNVDGRGRTTRRECGVPLIYRLPGTVRRRRRHMPITEVLNAPLSVCLLVLFPCARMDGWKDLLPSFPYSSRRMTLRTTRYDVRDQVSRCRIV